MRRDTSMALSAAASRGDMIGAGPFTLGGDSEPKKNIQYFYLKNGD